jgi:hypothetical protein
VATLEKPGIEMLFQLLDLESHGGLGHVENVSGLGETELFRHRVKYLKSAVGH